MHTMAMDFLYKKQRTTCLLAVVSPVSFSNLSVFFVSATVTCCGTYKSSFSSSLGHDNRVTLLSKRRGNLFLADLKVLFVLRRAGLFELFAVTRVFLHVLLK